MRPCHLLVTWLLCGWSTSYAETRIAVLDFELNDITSLPYTTAELQRTASMAPLLRQSLSQFDDVQLVNISAETQQEANAGFGYLFRFHDLAAKLGQQQGADWIVVSQHSKPSFLFSYLWTYLINVKTQTAVSRYDIELKGRHELVTQHGIDKLGQKIRQSINGQK
ncbi:DUF2380 domain-containing protein [Methylomonas sp. MgM2]